MTHRTPLLCVLTFMFLFCSAATPFWTAMTSAQQPQPAPPVYQVYWQPVYVPGDYVAVPRFVPLFDFCFGPRVVWQPRQQQPTPQLPAPQQ